MWTYFFLKQLVQSLKEKLIGYSIGEIFSQNRNEIIFGFYKKDIEDFYFIINLDPVFPHFKFYSNYQRAKKNSVDLFSDYLDLKIENIEITKGDRTFFFELEKKHKIIFKFHGNKANVIFKNKEIEIFRTKLIQDYDFKFIESAEMSIKDYKPENTIKSQFPYFDRWILEYLEKKDFNNFNFQEKIDFLKDLLNELNNHKIYLNDVKEIPFLHSLKLSENAIEFDNPLMAANEYSALKGKTIFMKAGRDKELKEIEKNLKKIDQAKKRISSRLDFLENNNEYEEEANLIMSNLHMFRDTTEAEIYDFYNEVNRKIKIKKGISPQKHAENLYRKNKNKAIEIKELNVSLNKLRDKKTHFEKLQKELNVLSEPKDLKNFIKKNSNDKELENTEENLPFRSFTIDSYKILVGQNAKKNDILTSQFAHKNDIWMHAKDVSGSHVVIKRQGQNKVPENVIEKAASMAAWFSKGRNDTYFPVLYTEKKNVRKAKGLASGQVLVDKYEVVIVKPIKPGEI